MPFKSQKQERKFFVLEKEGKLPEGTALKWAHETPDIKALPRYVDGKPKKKEAARYK